MNKFSNPIETIIDFAWATGAERFWVNNSKDEFKKLTEKSLELEDIKRSLANPVAWAKITKDGVLYDLRLQNNPYDNQSIIIPLYRYG